MNMCEYANQDKLLRYHNNNSNKPNAIVLANMSEVRVLVFSDITML